MGPFAGADYNLTICPLQSRLQHIYIGQPDARVDLNFMSESTLFHSQGLWILASVISLLLTNTISQVCSCYRYDW
jgi:hypothetical protein